MADSQEVGSNPRSNGQPKKKFGKQLTHFLCFPLLSDAVLQPFGSSLEYFRDVSTVPKREHPLRARERAEAERQKKLVESSQGSLGANVSSKEDCSGEADVTVDENEGDRIESNLGFQQKDPLGNTMKATGETFEESLKIVPSISHRPLGTYHLTIGVMNLSEADEFKKCEEIFKSLDLKQLLKDAENGPPNGSKVARRWKNNSNERDEGYEKAKEAAVANSSASYDNTGSVNPSKPHKDSANEQSLSTTDLSPMTISLLGLGAFNSPRRARVLYAHPCEQTSSTFANASSKPSYNPPFPDRLYNFALHIEAPFRAAGLIKETRPLTLHATLVNIRHKVQPKGGRTSKGKAWTHGRKRWDDSCIDARLLCTVFNEYAGDVEAARDALGADYMREQDDVNDEAEDGETEPTRNPKKKQDGRDNGPNDHSKEFLWAQDVPVDRIALCELGAKKSNDEALGLEYPPVLEKWITEA